LFLGTDTIIPSVNDFVIRASALSLKKHPSINVIYDTKSSSHIHSSTIDISVAVATDTGLITPIVRNADRKRLSNICTEVKNLATKAKENKLQPNEFQGGSFT
jgi:pyruvate/2-oxoglutarate dehydrogenase complex dihydrolipoamide acyltransferase (E2) component